MSRIFIVYRQSDSGMIARQIADRLAATYGAASVVTNVQDAPPGANLKDDTYKLATTSALVLAVIGPAWANDPRLHRPGDLVCFALETALANPHVRVVPVLVGGAMLPNAQLLPPSLQGLGARGVIGIRSDAFYEQDMQALMNAVRQAYRAKPAPPKAPSPQPSPRRVQSPEEPIRVVQREIVRRDDGGCMMLPLRLVGGVIGFIGSLLGVIVRTMLASVVSFIMGIVLMLLTGALVLFFGQALITNNFEIGLALSQMGQQISDLAQSVLPR